MKWLEIIDLRSVDSHRQLLGTQLQEFINEANEKTKKPGVKVYNCEMIDTNFSIHLFHDSKKVENRGSPLGLTHCFSFKRVWLG